jgi:hypothetical protein
MRSSRGTRGRRTSSRRAGRSSSSSWRWRERGRGRRQCRAPPPPPHLCLQGSSGSRAAARCCPGFLQATQTNKAATARSCAALLGAGGGGGGCRARTSPAGAVPGQHRWPAARPAAPSGHPAGPLADAFKPGRPGRRPRSYLQARGASCASAATRTGGNAGVPRRAAAAPYAKAIVHRVCAFLGSAPIVVVLPPRRAARSPRLHEQGLTVPSRHPNISLRPPLRVP